MSVGTFGLGGGASSMLIGRYSLGGFDIAIEVKPVPDVPSGGGSVGRPWLITPESPRYKEVTITVRYKGKTWITTYRVLSKLTKILVSITKVLNTVITNLQFKVLDIKSAFKQYRIKR